MKNADHVNRGANVVFADETLLFKLELRIKKKMLCHTVVLAHETQIIDWTTFERMVVCHIVLSANKTILKSLLYIFGNIPYAITLHVHIQQYDPRYVECHALPYCCIY